MSENLDPMSASEIPGPFDRASQPIRDCWSLGYHDGWAELPIAAGSQAVSVFAIDARSREIGDLQQQLASSRGELMAAADRLQHVTRGRSVAESHLISTLGRVRSEGT